MKLELKKIDHLEKDADGAHYSRDTYSIGKYEVTDDSTTLENGSALHEIYVRVVGSDSDRRYLPDIYYLDERMGYRKTEFKIQTIAMGTLDLEEYPNLLAAQKTALEVATILTRELITNRRT